MPISLRKPFWIIFFALAFGVGIALALATSRLPVFATAASGELTRWEARDMILESAMRFTPEIKPSDIMKGYPDGSIRANRAVTRAEAVVMASRAFSGLDRPYGAMQVVSPSFAYTDLLEFSWAEESISDMRRAGLLERAADNMFHGSEIIAKKELSRLLYRAEALYKSGKITASEYEEDDTWAIYWYLCGSDLESNSSAATKNLMQMMSVRLPDNVTLVIEAGGTREWHNGFDPSALTRYTYSADGLKYIGKAPLANMGESDTLKDFLEFCKKNYPADHTGVIFWDHGGGSADGVSFDELFDYDSLTLDELRRAFDAVYKTDGEGRPFEFVGFDACLMATIEVIDTFKGIAKYLVASEEMEPGCGWDYSGFLAKLGERPFMNGAQLGKAICDSYYESCLEMRVESEITLSLIDLAATDSLITAYKDLGAEFLLSAATDQSFFPAFGRAARNTESYGLNNNWAGYTNIVDLGDLVRNSGEELLPQYGGAVLDALDKCVLYKVNGAYRSASSGVSCYFSLDNDKSGTYGGGDEGPRGSTDGKASYRDVIASEAFVLYFDYLINGGVDSDGSAYISTLADKYPSFNKNGLTFGGISTPNESDIDNAIVDISDSGTASLTLGHEIFDLLTAVFLELSYYDTEKDVFYSLGIDNDLEIDWESGGFSDRFHGAWGSIDGALCHMEVSEETDDYVVYAIPINLNGEPHSLAVSYTYSDDKYEILGTRKGPNEYGLAEKYLRKLVPGDIVQPLHDIIENASAIPDNLEDMVLLTPQMQPVGEIVVNEDTAFRETQLIDGLYLINFKMLDAKNEAYYSAAPFVEIIDGQTFIGGVLKK